VMMWIHGGGATSGSGLDFTFDGGNLASRNDIVVFTPNYRLGTLGFLAANKEVAGNYALSDLINALKFIQKFGPMFGADPDRVTIAGESSSPSQVDDQFLCFDL